MEYTRREFTTKVILPGLGSLGLLLFGACRPLEGTVTPTPTRTPEPTVTPTPYSTPTPYNPPPTATGTPTPNTPTLTPEVKDIIEYLQGELVKNIPHLENYPRASRAAAIQVESQGLIGVLDKYVYPAVELPVKLQVDRKIDALNGFGIPDKALEDEAIGQVLLPVELREVNIRTGVRTTANLETGIYNVSLDKDLGKSPQEWLREMAVRDYGDKTHVVWKWINEFPADYGPRDVWTNSWQAYSKAVKTIDNLLLFIREYPIFLRGPPSGNLVPQLTEQTQPYYSVLLGRLFSKAVFDVVAKYPTDASGRFTHSEPFILMVNSSEDLLLPYRFGFWLKKQPFVDDYKGKPYSTPYAEVRRSSGTYERIRLN